LQPFARQLGVPAGFTATVAGGGRAQLSWTQPDGGGPGGDFDRIRAQRAVYSLLADLVVADARRLPLPADGLQQLAALPKTLSLAVAPAGARPQIPSGFAQAIPGTMVMFTLMILLTGGGAPLVHERLRGLLRRLASAPLTRSAVVRGKALARLALAAV